MGLCNFKLLQRKQKRLSPARETTVLKYSVGLPLIYHIFAPVDNITYQQWGQKSSELFASFDFLKSEFFSPFLCRQWCNLDVLPYDVAPARLCIKEAEVPAGTPLDAVR